MQALTGYTTVNAAIGGLQVGDMIFQLVFFILLLILVRKFAWGPVMSMMKKREDYVASEIETAEKSRADAERAQEEAQTRLNETKQEAQNIIEEAKTLGNKQEREIIENAKQEAERIKQDAQEEIQSEKEKAVQTLQDQVASLSVLIASKVIEKEISAEDQEKLIHDYIKEAGEEQ